MTKADKIRDSPHPPPAPAVGRRKKKDESVLGEKGPYSGRPL